MTNEDIIRMAQDVGAARLHSTGNIIFGVNALQHFVELIVAAEERDRLAQPDPVIYARKEGDLIVVDLPQVPTGSGGISKDTKREPILPGGGGGSGVPTIDGWPLYSGLPPQEEQGLTATPLPAIKLQDECESQYKSFAQSAQVIGGQYDPRRKWVGLTDEEYEAMAEQYVTNCYFDTLKYAKAIEAKLKEKNYD